MTLEPTNDVEREKNVPAPVARPSLKNVRVRHVRIPASFVAQNQDRFARILATDLTAHQPTVRDRAKQILFGAPISTAEAHNERVGKAKALAILSSDALSSVAYGTEASLAILVTAGLGLEIANIGIAIAIIALLAIVAFSYRQTIKHYPTGGGSYIVAKDHLGVNAGLIAAAALLLDYILTVSVSISAGVNAITTGFPGLLPWTVPIGVLFIAVIVVINLRGVRESGSIFAIPTYLFVVSYLLTIAIGIVKAIFQGGLFRADHAAPTLIPHSSSLSLFLILTAFASGCSAMTGTEAIADGVPIFKGAKPADQSRNAATTLSWMATLLAVMFAGTTYLAWRFGVSPQVDSHPTLLGQIARLIWHDFGPVGNAFFFLFQIATALILTLAANTSFSDFPRLSSILARDDYMPHLFGLRGDRLAFNTGILALGVLSAGLLIIFGGNTDALINLYALGVFTAFTLSQSGMIGRWRSEKEPGWQRGVAISTVGAIATGLVTLIIIISKTPRGAWVVLLLVPLIVVMFKSIHRHYQRVQSSIDVMPEVRPGQRRQIMVVPIASLNRLALRGLAYARSLSPYVLAVYVALDPQEETVIHDQWLDLVKTKKFFRGGPVADEIDDDILTQSQGKAMRPGPELVIIDSPFRALARPLLLYIDRLQIENPDATITVVLPEFVTTHFWEGILHNQTALRLKFALLSRPHIATTNVPYRLPAQTTTKPPVQHPLPAD